MEVHDGLKSNFFYHSAIKEVLFQVHLAFYHQYPVDNGNESGHLLKFLFNQIEYLCFGKMMFEKDQGRDGKNDVSEESQSDK